MQLLAPEQDLGVPFHQGVHDVEELLVIGLEVADGDAEAVGQGHLLLHGVVAVHVVGGHVGLIPPGLPHQMTAVGGGVDHHVLRLRLQSALDDGLQVFVFQLRLLKGQIVHEDDETVVAVLDLADDLGEVLELVLVDLDHAQALIVVLVQHRLDAGGFSRAGLAVEQHVVALPAGHEGLRVGDEALLLGLVSHQVVQVHVPGIGDGDEKLPLRVLRDAEGLVETEFSHAHPAVESGDDLIQFVLRGGFLDVL